MKKIFLLVTIISLLAGLAFSCGLDSNVEAKNNRVTNEKPEQALKKPSEKKAEPETTSSIPTTKINWKEEIHDFGKIPKDKPVSHVFTLTNMGTEPLILENVKPVCGCTIADWPKEPVAPGENATIKATFNAKKVGRFSKSITVLGNIDPNPQRLTLKAEVVE